MRPASIKETKNGYNDENYITPRTLRAALANYSPSGGGSSEGGTTDYNKLENKPSINGVTLSQNKTLKDLGIQPEGAYLTEVPDTYKTKDENDRLYQPKGSYQPAGSYQETLVSGDNIKTVNGQSLLGEGDLTIAGGGGGGLIDTLPVGTMIPYGSAETPDNWLSCNGQAVSRTTYKHLFEVIGTSYGEGDGSTTFNLPDKRGRVSVGYDPDQAMFNKVGAHVGANTHTLTIAEMPSHQHDMYEVNPSTGGGSYKQNYTNGGNYQVTLGSCKTVSEQGYFGLLGQFKTGGGQAHSIVQASEVDHWIIKAYPLSSPEGTLDPLPVGTIVEYDGEQVPDGFEEIQELDSKQRWHYQSEFKYNSITNGTWSLLSPYVTTEKLPKGNYLVLYNIGLHAGGTGTVTINAGFDGGRLDVHRRASMPLTAGLITNTEVTHYFELEEARAVTLSAYAYSNANCSVNSFSVDIIRLDCEEMGLIIDNAQEFSNDEKIIGTWNGKKLYRKKFEYMGLSANAENVVGTIDNADEVYIEEAHLVTTNDAKLSYPLNMVGYAGNTTDKVYVYSQAGYIKVHTTGGWGSNAWKVVVVAKYTKTTD